MKKCSLCGQEYLDDATVCPVDGKPLEPVSKPPSAKKEVSVEKLAKNSLLFGLLAFIPFFSSPFLALAAIVLGHKAWRKERHSGQRTKTSPIWGLGLGYACLLLIVFFIWSGLSGASSMAQELRCSSQLKQIGLAARIWSDDHDATFPKTFLELTNVTNEFAGFDLPKLMICPADSKRLRHHSAAAWDPANFTYEYVLPGKQEKDVQDKVIIRCPIHGLEVLGDGSVRWPEKPFVRK